MRVFRRCCHSSTTEKKSYQSARPIHKEVLQYDAPESKEVLHHNAYRCTWSQLSREALAFIMDEDTEDPEDHLCHCFREGSSRCGSKKKYVSALPV